MNVQFSQCPVSWGVERGDAEVNPSWEDVLDAVAGLGYDGVELGPLGFLPNENERLLAALDERGLQLTAGYLMQPLADRDQRRAVLDLCRATCHALAAAGAEYLIVIDALDAERSAAAGRSEQAQRLDDEAFDDLAVTAMQAARMASDDYGLTPVFHPHVGTYVEFRDEIDHLLAATDPESLYLCLDSGHSAFAGIDPVELAAAYAGRVRYLHLKDVRVGVLRDVRSDQAGFQSAVARGVFCPLGDGEVDFRRLFAELDRQGYEGWAAVEQDRSEPSERVSGLRATEDAARSLAFLAEMQVAEPASAGRQDRRSP